MKPYVVYFRVWPKKSRSSVPLAAQKAEAARFVTYNNGQGQGEVIAEFADKETKKLGQRPELAKAIEHAIRSEATLLIVHLGRLARNVTVTRMLVESRVEFFCVDNPKVHRQSIDIIANMADEERRKISDRSKTALAAAKARGVKLGSADPRVKKANYLRGTYKAIAVAAEKKREGVRSTYAFLMPEIQARRERGETMPEIMDWLNQQGYTTTAGKPFTQTAVWRLIDRYLGKEYLGNSKKGTQGSKVARRCAS